MFWDYDFDASSEDDDYDEIYRVSTMTLTDSDNSYHGSTRVLTPTLARSHSVFNYDYAELLENSPIPPILPPILDDGSRVFANYLHGVDRTRLAKLENQRKTRKFLDVMVQVDGREFPCHRAVLSSTPYFETMLSSDFSESSSGVIQLREIDSNTFSKILDFLYTGEIRIGKDDVQDILQTAHMLLLDKIVQYCRDFIEDNLCPFNCLGVLFLADMYGFSALKKKARNMTVSNVQDVTQDEEFLSLSAQQLTDLLGKDHLFIFTNEDCVVNSVLRWLDNAPETHQTAILKILQKIRLSFVRVSVLQRLESHPVIRESTEYLEKIATAKDRHLFGTQVVGEDASVPRPGISDDLAIIVGGWKAVGGKPTPLQSILCFDPDCQQYYHITTLPTIASEYMGVACAERSLYVTGGRVHPVIGQGPQSFSRQAFRYDFPSDTWLRLPDMPRGWAEHQSVVVDGKLFVVYATSLVTMGMDCYDPEEGAWMNIHVRPSLRPSSNWMVTAFGDKVVIIVSKAKITDVKDGRCSGLRASSEESTLGGGSWLVRPRHTPYPCYALLKPSKPSRPIQEGGLGIKGKLCVHAFDVKTKDWSYADIQMDKVQSSQSVEEDVDIRTTTDTDKLYIRTGSTEKSDLYIFDAEEETLTKGDQRDWHENVLCVQCKRSYRYVKQKDEGNGIVDTICYELRDNHSTRPTFGAHHIPERQTPRDHSIPASPKQTFRYDGGGLVRVPPPPPRDLHIPTRRTFVAQQTPLPFVSLGHSFLQTKKSRLGWYCRDLAALEKDDERVKSVSLSRAY
ncbi:kelch-like protein 6 [Branchiostoma floridae x Branchiostoma belcheri]